MKKCGKCGEVKPFECFSKNKTRKDGFGFQCKECYKQYIKQNKEKILELHRKFTKKNKEKKSNWNKEYRKNNIDKVCELRKKHKESISKSYVSAQLKIPVDEISQDLYELKKEQLQIYRLIKQLKKETENGNQ